MCVYPKLLVFSTFFVLVYLYLSFSADRLTPANPTVANVHRFSIGRGEHASGGQWGAGRRWATGAGRRWSARGPAKGADGADVGPGIVKVHALDAAGGDRGPAGRQQGRGGDYDGQGGGWARVFLFKTRGSPHPPREVRGTHFGGGGGLKKRPKSPKPRLLVW